MLPNLAPVLAMFIIMGIFNIWLDIGTAMIASITVGIAVDDTIHIFEGFFRRIKSMDVKQALLETYQESGKAIIITSFILSAQFSVLIFSNFIPLRNFGLLTTIGIITALVFDLILLPALLILKYSNRKV
jgi:predicted RND superfamily exporter protein